MKDAFPGGYEDLRAPAEFVDESAWRRLFNKPDARVRGVVAQIVRDNAAPLATLFYDTLLSDLQAKPLLSHELVAHRLNASLQRWMIGLLGSPDDFDVPALIKLQQTVGEVHARVRVPMWLVSRGARILKDGLSRQLRASDLDRDEISFAHEYMGGMFDLALEVMSVAYMHDAHKGMRAGEAYRLFALGQNAATERERQRAALLEWSQAVLLETHYHRAAGGPPLIRGSDFGLWMQHKGGAMFEGTAELPPILEAMKTLDNDVLPALTRATEQGDPEQVGHEVERFQRNVNDIKYLLLTLFDRVTEVDGGRDPLTQLLNRRFLRTVLGREIALANSGVGAFSVLMADVDHFKRINDRYGHDGGDAVLRQMAELLQGICRSGDYVFRYGGEEFLIVLVDVDADVLPRVAEKLRVSVEKHPFRMPEGGTLDITLSVGAAAFDGHPDPDRLVTRADKALYVAKQGGRNRWHMG